MSNSMSPVQDRAKTAFFGVEGNNLSLDGDRSSNNLVKNGMIAALNQLNFLLANFKQGGVPDRSGLDDLSNACTELSFCSLGIAFAETIQKRHVHVNNHRLMEGSDQVLAHRCVDGRLAADGRVNHGKQGRWDLHERNSSHVSSCDVASEIADDASSHRNAARISVHLHLEHVVFDFFLHFPVLGCLSRGKNFDMKSFASLAELLDEFFAVKGEHILVCDQNVCMSRNRLHDFLSKVPLQRHVEANA
mmetsp:Transcript_9637/g.32262  ORF Transcript_9637/g.32262 Transcript_9637/m.32262 type:complete len:247 (+) Transcript_9637:3816-4556(+)